MTLKKPVLLVGCGGHSRSLIDVIEAEDKWEIVGLIGLPEQIGERVLGYQVIGSDDDLKGLVRDVRYAVIAVGQVPDSIIRRHLAELIDDLGFTSPVIVSPYAVVSKHAVLGAGTVVGHGAIVNAGAVVGLHCIINSRALIEHDVSVKDHCHVSTGALVNGSVKIGPDSFVGSGAVIREGIKLPAKTIISAGKRVMAWPLL